jgi:hypothetical protein
VACSLVHEATDALVQRLHDDVDDASAAAAYALDVGPLLVEVLAEAAALYVCIVQAKGVRAAAKAAAGAGAAAAAGGGGGMRAGVLLDLEGDMAAKAAAGRPVDAFLAGHYAALHAHLAAAPDPVPTREALRSLETTILAVVGYCRRYLASADALQLMLPMPRGHLACLPHNVQDQLRDAAAAAGVASGALHTRMDAFVRCVEPYQSLFGPPVSPPHRSPCAHLSGVRSSGWAASRCRSPCCGGR